VSQPSHPAYATTVVTKRTGATFPLPSPSLSESTREGQQSAWQIEAMSDWNKGIIEEFRANEGQVGGPFAGAPLLLLHTTGAKSGEERVHPVMYRDLGEGSVAVFASFAGQPVNPAWYHNLVANPDVSAEIGTGTGEFRARVADDAERAPIWEQQKAEYPGFADYERKTDRQIPVVILDPR